MAHFLPFIWPGVEGRRKKHAAGLGMSAWGLYPVDAVEPWECRLFTRNNETGPSTNWLDSM